MKYNSLDGAIGTKKKEIMLVKIERLLDNYEKTAVPFTWRSGITLEHVI